MSVVQRLIAIPYDGHAIWARRKQEAVTRPLHHRALIRGANLSSQSVRAVAPIQLLVVRRTRRSDPPIVGKGSWCEKNTNTE